MRKKKIMAISKDKTVRLSDIKHEKLLLVEGEKDRIKAFDDGIGNSIFQSGGANTWKDEFTDELIAKGVTEVTIVYDVDAAGIKGAEKVAGKLLSAGLKVKNVLLPLAGTKEENDYFDYRKTHSVEDFQKLIDDTDWLECEKVDEDVWLKSGTLLRIKSDGVYEIKHKKVGKNVEETEALISNFHYIIMEEQFVNDEDKRYVIEVRISGGVQELEVAGNELFDNNTFFKKILPAKIEGVPFIDSRKHNLIQELAAQISKPVKTNAFAHPGFQDDGSWRDKGMTIKDGEILKKSNTFAKNGIEQTDRICFNAYNNNSIIDHVFLDFKGCLSSSVFWTALAHTLTPCLRGMFGDLQPQQMILFITGTTGEGKSEAALMFQAFYGEFNTQDHLLSCTATPKSLEKAGSMFGKAVCVIDDLKSSVIGDSMKDLTRVLQGAATGSARNRLTTSGDFNSSKGMNATIIIPAEDTISGEASIKGRSLEVEQVMPKGSSVAFAKCKKMRQHYNCILPFFIAAIQSFGKAEKDAVMSDYYRFCNIGKEQGLNSRLAESLAFMKVAIYLFLYFTGRINLAPEAWRELDKVAERQNSMFSEEKIGNRFLVQLQAGITSGMIEFNSVGFFDNNCRLNIYPDNAFNAVETYLVRSRQSLNFSKSAVGKDLRDSSLIDCEKGRLGRQSNRNGRKELVWRFYENPLSVTKDMVE